MRQDEHLSALQPGARLHLYTIGAILGAGGFGITYRAREDITNREVAIKEYLPAAFAVRDRNGSTVRPLNEGAARDFEWGLERFRQEAKLLIDLKHPNIVPVLAYFEANATGYLVMEFQDGTSLGHVLRAKTLTEQETLEIMVPLLDGVEEVHRHGFLHRDIKPENIFLRRDGVPLLLDFGAARAAPASRPRRPRRRRHRASTRPPRWRRATATAAHCPIRPRAGGRRPTGSHRTATSTD